VARDDIRLALWTSDTFVDFDQGVNFAIKQVREALGEDADHQIYIQTVPKRGYKFVAPVEVVGAQPSPGQAPVRTDLALHKLLWTHIAELRLAEDRRRKRRQALLIALSVALALAAVVAMVFWGVKN
jgi:DNA-binding winged helix-turn-helix (wHTH) protein